MSGGAFLLAMISIFFPVVAILAAIYFMLFTPHFTLGLFFLCWWIIWDEPEEER